VEDILRDINTVVGVTGSFVCSGEGQVLASALPNLFDETILSTVGRIMSQTIAGLTTTRRRKVGDIDLLYREGRVVVKNLREGCLCILCVRNINVPLLNLTANVANKKLAEKIQALGAAKLEEKPAPTVMAVPVKQLPGEKLQVLKGFAEEVSTVEIDESIVNKWREIQGFEEMGTKVELEAQGGEKIRVGVVGRRNLKLQVVLPPATCELMDLKSGDEVQVRPLIEGR
jgi:predicted regulator of Ras-like GTPase activity (Roadblock/LC7/MglB family)